MNTMMLLGLGALLVLLIGGYLIYKRRSKSSDALTLPPPDLGDLVDYTQEESPTSNSLVDRFRALSLPGKILLGLLPILGLISLGAAGFFALSLFSPRNRTPPPPPPMLAISKSDLVNPTTINVVAQGSNIPDGTALQFELLANEQPVTWAASDEASLTMNGGALDVRLNRGADAAAVDCTQDLAVRLSGTVNGQPIVASNEFFVPPLFEPDFCASSEPTPVPTRTPRPTAATSPTPAGEQPTVALPSPTAESVPSQGIAVQVGNGGNVRIAPSGEAGIVTQIALGETVDVLGRLADSSWYRIRTAAGLEGWTFAGALNPPADLIEQIPVQDAAGVAQEPPADPAQQPTTRPPTPEDLLTPTTAASANAAASGDPVQVQVGNGGNVRAEPTSNAPVVAQIVLGQTVDVLGRLADNSWYRIRTPDGVEGWTFAGALNPPAEVINQIPVQNASGEPVPIAAVAEPTNLPAPPDPTTVVQLPLDLSERTVVVYTSGQVYQEPSFDAPPAAQELTTGETVEVLSKTGDAMWYKVRTLRDEVGWAHNSVLTVPPELVAQVPVENPS